MVVRKSFILFLILLGVVSPLTVHCDMVSPDNTTYLIYADAVDAGGILSTGDIYSLEDTLGEAIATSTSGGVYQVLGGYQAMTSSSIAMNISDSSIDLGDLNSGLVKTASTIVSVTTGDQSGYSLSVGSITWGDKILNSVGVDHAVTAGVEEYGFEASGVDSQLVGDWPVVANQLISVSTIPVVDSPTTLIFKASISGASVSGVYTQSVVFQASVNLEL